MAITINQLYIETSNLFSLNLIAGKNGLNRIMKWVYVSEDYTTADFLNGGELIISTGININTHNEWLYNYIYTMIEHNTCGIILNIGKYLYKNDISQKIIALCEDNNYPLFTMPWNIHIYDITKNYYGKIFLQTQKNTSISDSFLSVIKKDNHFKESLTTLENSGFPINSSYTICTFVSSIFIKSNNKYTYSLETTLEHLNIKYHFLTDIDKLIFIIEKSKDIVLDTLISRLRQIIISYYPNANITIGIGSNITSLKQLKDSCHYSNAACLYAKFLGLDLYYYDNMDFYKLLLGIQDVSILKDYVTKYLGRIIDYDTSHKSSYLETLKYYVFNNGSIKAIGDKLFCHRNTINYRIKFLKEQLLMDLDSATSRFNIMTSFFIVDYLSFYRE